MILNRLGRLLVKSYKTLAIVGIYAKNHQEDRQILENIIFPYFKEKVEYHKIIFIGADWYTKCYNKVFKKKLYWTIDLDPKKKKFGSKRHIIDSIENLNRYFNESEVDLIICNGVFGWGLNSPESIDKSFNISYNLLRKDGVFILGWNDIPDHRPINLDNINSLKQFTPFYFAPLSANSFLTNNPNRHTFNFYIKSKPSLTD